MQIPVAANETVAKNEIEAVVERPFLEIVLVHDQNFAGKFVIVHEIDDAIGQLIMREISGFACESNKKSERIACQGDAVGHRRGVRQSWREILSDSRHLSKGTGI